MNAPGKVLGVQMTKYGGYVAFESLDGKFVYFSKDFWQTSIWRIPAGRGGEANVVKSSAGFAVASRGIYFITPHSEGSSVLQFHDFATGKVTTVAAIHRRIQPGLSVSLDERYVLYTASRSKRHRPHAGRKFPVGVPLIIFWHTIRRSRQAYSLSKSFPSRYLPMLTKVGHFFCEASRQGNCRERPANLDTMLR